MGSHLVNKLIERGDEVLVLDSLITGDLKNLEHLKENPKFSFQQIDVSTAFHTHVKADQIYHLASPASPNIHSPKSYHALSFETMQVNSAGTQNMAHMAVHMGAKFLFASTSEVYGNPMEHPQKETYRGNVSTTGPRSVYDESKRFGETITAAFIRSKQLNGRIIRIFNTYGPQMPDDGRVIMEFIKAAKDNNPFPVFGDGAQTRSFCYVDDLIEGIIAAMEKGRSGQVYNLGNPQECTILELAQIIKKLTNVKSDVKQADKLPEDDPLQRCPDITKAKKELEWEPKVKLEEGLEKLIESL